MRFLSKRVLQVVHDTIYKLHLKVSIVPSDPGNN